jgi:hypothetical protein
MLFEENQVDFSQVYPFGTGWKACATRFPWDRMIESRWKGTFAGGWDESRNAGAKSF